jgi:putative colanic acid biosynthesis acetyltransferase WcaF
MGHPFSISDRLARAAWGCARLALIRWTPRPMHAWRAWVYRRWGARLGARVHIYPGAIVWAPWNLECGDDACIGEGAEVYNVARVTLGRRAVVSQGAFLCSASHDYADEAFPLTRAPIELGERAWVAARAIVLPGVSVGARTVVGAGSVVTRSLPADCVCGGNPCRVIKRL